MVFATIANENDAVLTIFEEDKTNPRVLMRLDPLSNFEDNRITDSGKLPYNEGTASKILAYDVIPNEFIGEFRGILERSKPENDVTKGMVQKLRKWGITEI